MTLRRAFLSLALVVPLAIGACGDDAEPTPQDTTTGDTATEPGDTATEPGDAGQTDTSDSGQAQDTTSTELPDDDTVARLRFVVMTPVPPADRDTFSLTLDGAPLTPDFNANVLASEHGYFLLAADAVRALPGDHTLALSAAFTGRAEPFPGDEISVDLTHEDSLDLSLVAGESYTVVVHFGHRSLPPEAASVMYVLDESTPHSPGDVLFHRARIYIPQGPELALFVTDCGEPEGDGIQLEPGAASAQGPFEDPWYVSLTGRMVLGSYTHDWHRVPDAAGTQRIYHFWPGVWIATPASSGAGVRLEAATPPACAETDPGGSNDGPRQ